MEILDFRAPIGNLTADDLSVDWNGSSVPMRIRSLSRAEAPVAVVSSTTNRGDDDVRTIDFLAFDGRLWEPYEKSGRQFTLEDVAPGTTPDLKGPPGLRAFMSHPFRSTASNAIVEASRRGVGSGKEIVVVPQIAVGGDLWRLSKGPVVTSIRFPYVPKGEVWLTQQPPSWRRTVPMTEIHKFWSAFDAESVAEAHAEHFRTAPAMEPKIRTTDGWDKEACIRAMQDEGIDLIARHMFWTLRKKNHVDAPRGAMKAWVEIERILGDRWPEGNHLKSTQDHAMTIPNPESVQSCDALLPAVREFAADAEGLVPKEVFTAWSISISILDRRMAAEADLNDIWSGV